MSMNGVPIIGGPQEQFVDMTDPATGKVIRYRIVAVGFLSNEGMMQVVQSVVGSLLATLEARGVIPPAPAEAPPTDAQADESTGVGEAQSE